MSSFQSDIAAKSSIARCARNRKCGSKSKKVSLPCDNLSPAQLKALSGPVKTYKLVPGIPDEELSTWPEHVRKLYREKFNR